MVFDKAGNLYGAAAGRGSQNPKYGPPGSGCGLVFKLSPSKKGLWKYTVLHEFSYSDAEDPASGVILDPKGKLFGSTVDGGAYGGGVVFEITP